MFASLIVLNVSGLNTDLLNIILMARHSGFEVDVDELLRWVANNASLFVINLRVEDGRREELIRGAVEDVVGLRVGGDWRGAFMEVMPEELVYEVHRRLFDVFLNSVKREIVISRDPFFIASANDNSALVLIGEGGVVYLAFNDFGDGERGLVKARISKGLSLTYAVEGVPFRAFVIDEKSVDIFKTKPYFILIPLNVDRDLGRRFILRSVLRKDVGGWSGEFREVDYDEFRDRASDVLIRFLFHPVGGLSVKRAIISRDPFSIVGLTNEFAFALMGESDELYLIYKDLDDDEGMVRTSVKEDSIIFMGTQL